MSLALLQVMAQTGALANPPEGLEGKRLSPPGSSRPLLAITAVGGLCRDTGHGHMCSSTVVVHDDGSYRVSGDVPQELKGALAQQLIQRLRTAIEHADFTALRATPFTGPCPTAWDGQELTYTFSTPHGPEQISSCRTAIDHKTPVFQTVSEIDQAIHATP